MSALQRGWQLGRTQAENPFGRPMAESETTGPTGLESERTRPDNGPARPDDDPRDGADPRDDE